MAFDEQLADDIRARIGDHPGLTEKRMFGGIAFMVHGNMAVGVHGDELMVRVGRDAHDDAVARPGARIFDLSARPMRGWLVVSREGFVTDAALDAWVRQGVAHAEGLPRNRPHRPGKGAWRVRDGRRAPRRGLLLSMSDPEGALQWLNSST